MLANASPHAITLWLPPARSSTTPNTSGARNATVKPASDAALAYIRSHISDCAWDGMTLVFSEQKKQ